MTTIWNRLEGKWLAGKYSLRECLGESEGAAFFQTTIGTERQTAALKLIPETSSSAGEEQLKLWRIAARISHPNMLRLLDYGRVEEDGETFLYAVFEFPDDTLAVAADRGPLSAQETREVLVAAVAGLRYIHSQGLVHASIDASHVVAVGNEIKLSTDTLRLPSLEATTAEDVRALGALAYQLLTGQPLKPGSAPDLSSIPEPFRNIIKHCLARDPNQRWSLERISAVVNPPARPTVAAAQPEKPEPANPSRPFPKWIYVATPAFLIVVILLFREITPKPDTAAPAPSPAPLVASPVAPQPAIARNWRVIAYTFSRRAAAEKKAQSINRKWSDARAEVFQPGATKSPAYLVALGGPMSRDEASRFLKTARGKGMPRSTYVRSYSP